MLSGPWVVTSNPLIDEAAASSIGYDAGIPCKTNNEQGLIRPAL